MLYLSFVNNIHTYYFKLPVSFNIYYILAAVGSFLSLSIVSTLPLLSESSIAAIRHKNTNRRLKWDAPAVATPKRYERRRGVNIGLMVKMLTTEKSKSFKALEKEIESLAQAMKGDKHVPSLTNTTFPTRPLLLKPAFECDRWDSGTRTCWLDRNTGDTVTFSLSTGFQSRRRRPDVVWRREFVQKGSRTVKEFVISPQKSSRNLVIGRRGYELRISPVTELDIDDNQFSASFIENNKIPYAKVNFRIRIVPEDLGFVYIGETLDLAIESFVTLPIESMSYHWYTEREGEFATLPSNMRVSPTGETLRISELRQEQEGIVACSIYTNKNIHAAKKRFLIKELTKNKNVLKAFSSHNITFQEENLKRHKKTLRVRGKQIAHDKAEIISHRPHKTAKNKTKRVREINEANVEGDLYTIIQSNEDTAYNAHPKPGKMASAYERINSAAKNTKGQILSFSNSSDIDTIVNIDLNQEKNVEDDKVAQIVSYCAGDLQCSKHASCIRTSLKNEGFCRCLSGFYGPGIFCREEI